MPFVLTSWTLLLFSTGNDTIIRTVDVLTPEQRLLRARKLPAAVVVNFSEADDKATHCKENGPVLVEQAEV